MFQPAKSLQRYLGQIGALHQTLGGGRLTRGLPRGTCLGIVALSEVDQIDETIAFLGHKPAHIEVLLCLTGGVLRNRPWFVGSCRGLCCNLDARQSCGHGAQHAPEAFRASWLRHGQSPSLTLRRGGELLKYDSENRGRVRRWAEAVAGVPTPGPQPLAVPNRRAAPPAGYPTSLALHR